MTRKKSPRTRPESEDRVCESKDGFFCIVDGNIFGFWRSRAEAEGGMQVEQRRAASRRARKEARA